MSKTLNRPRSAQTLETPSASDFSRVLLTDRLAWELFALAAREQMLFMCSEHEASPTPRLRAMKQRVLSLLVLFDNVIVHDFSAGAYRIPDLENDGLMQVVARHKPIGPVQPLQTHWRLGPLKDRKRPPNSLLQSLQIFNEERPLILDRLRCGKSELDQVLARALGVSRRTYLDALFDYAIACVEGDRVALQENIMNRLPDDLLAEITCSLFDFNRNGDETLDPINAMLVMAIAFADEIRVIQEISSQLGIGVATEHYRSKYTSAPARLDANGAADHFVTIRSVLAEDRGVLPHIRDIRHALALRRDPNLMSLREMLREFHKAVQFGEVDAVVAARREVGRARRAIEKRESWQRRLDWVTYLSVPLGIAEGLAGIPPIAGMSFAVLGATGAAAMARAKQRHGWVLFSM